MNGWLKAAILSLAVLPAAACKTPEALSFGEVCEPGVDICQGGVGSHYRCAPDCEWLVFTCGDGPELEPPHQELGCPLDGICRPEACETVWTCRDDCSLKCDVPELTAAPPTDFLISAIYPVRSVAEAEAASLDLDGDLLPDNKAGGMLGSLDPSYVHDPFLSYNESIAAGRLVMAARVYPADPPGSGLGLVQVIAARLESDATPLLDGTDRLVLRPEASGDGHLCGQWDVGSMSSDPAQVAVMWPIPTREASTPLWVHLEGARLEGRIDGAGFHEAILAGGIPQSELREALYAYIQADPSLVALVDGCPYDGNAIDGCEAVVPGEGDCIQDGVVSDTEFRCQSIVDQLLRPDLPPWITGTEGRISFGLKFDAVPAVVVE